ncbi:MAG: hypothetical protein ACKKL6_00185 [Candidatus Komeilibacteria bacterium]
MNKYIIFSVIGLAIILSAGTALAYQGDMAPKMNKEDMQQHREEMQAIFDNNEYGAWQTEMTTRADEMQAHVNEMRASINEDTFNKMSEMHELMQAGDYEAAQALREELGIGGFGKGFGRHGGMREGRFQPQSAE